MEMLIKHSGIEWIGEIPAEWKIQRFKSVIHSMKKGNGITKEDVVANGEVQCVRYGEIYSKYSGSFAKCVSTTNLANVSSPQFFSYGDILFACTGELTEEIGKNVVYVGSEECLAGGDIIIAKHSQNPVFLNYAMNSAYAQAQKSRDKTKLKVVHISASEIGNVRIALPPIYEQTKVASFLDGECARIDSIIEQTRASIEEYKKLKQALITEAVTKGVRPGRVMKDSGVEWIGEIPADCEMARFQDFGDYKKGPFGSSITKSMFVEKSTNTYKVYEQKNAINKDSQLGYYYISEEKYHELLGFAVKAGDIIVSCAGTIGECFILPVDCESGVINQALMRIRINTNTEGRYFVYLFGSVLKYIADKYSNGSAMKNIPPFSILKKVKVPLFSLDEQHEIADWLDEKTEEINQLISKKESFLSEMENYKRSIIYEYVTGKKEVPA